MTRILITGRNNAIPRDVAQSMAYMMPERRRLPNGASGGRAIKFAAGADLEAALSSYMREKQIFNQAAAIRALLTKALKS